MMLPAVVSLMLGVQAVLFNEAAALDTMEIDREVFVYNSSAYGEWTDWGACRIEDKCSQIRLVECLDDSYENRVSNYRLNDGCNVKYLVERRRCRGEELEKCQSQINEKFEKIDELQKSCGGQGKSIQHKIIGGEASESGKWPAFLSLWKRMRSDDDMRGPYCGATLISPYHAITAAHCIIPLFEGRYSMRRMKRDAWQTIADLTSNKLFASVNNHDLEAEEGDERVIEVKRIYIHKKFDIRLQTRYDVAILKLAEPLKEQPFMCLPTSDKQPPKKTKCMAVGMGSLGSRDNIDLDLNLDDLGLFDLFDMIMGPRQFSHFGGLGSHPFKQSFQSASALHEVEIPLASPRSCSRFYRMFDKRTQICAGEEGRDTCGGDSGGGLFCKQDDKWILTGVTSYGSDRGCGHHPGVYTSVPAMRNWIREALLADSFE